MKPKKIIVRIVGGIGNQLFIYAAARRLSIINNAELVLDCTSGFKYDYLFKRNFQLDHFNISCKKANSPEFLIPHSRYKRFLLRNINKVLPFSFRNYISQNGMDFNPKLLSLTFNGTLFLEGYWQSEDYFIDIEDVLREDLQITPPGDYINNTIRDLICNSKISVAVHIRFFNGVEANKSSLIKYYKNAIDFMQRIAPDAIYFIFSDSPNHARDLIQLPDNRVILVANNEGDENAYADLWLMSQCHHFIIANSTFSWWGAWLGKNADKIVVAPNVDNDFIQPNVPWGFSGLLPDSWIKL